MLAAIAAATLTGAVGSPISVEVHVSNGLPGFTTVSYTHLDVYKRQTHGCNASVPLIGDASFLLYSTVRRSTKSPL